MFNAHFRLTCQNISHSRTHLELCSLMISLVFYRPPSQLCQLISFFLFFREALQAMLLALKCSLKTQECHEVLQKPGQGKPSLQQDLKNSKVDFPGLPIQHKPLTRLCDQLHWNNSQFYPLYTCYHLLFLPHLYLNLIPLQPSRM